MNNKILKAESNALCKSYQEYMELLELDKENKKNNILIETGMLPHENFNYKLIESLIPNSIKNEKFKNLGLNIKIVNLIQSLNYVNELVINSNQLYEFIKNTSPFENYMSVYNFHKLTSVNGHIIHLIKKFIDEMISIIYILKYGGSDLKVKSIGSYIKDGQDYLKCYDEFKNFFNDVNEIDNAFKHSYSNTLVPGYFGTKENIIVVAYSKNGKNIYNPKMKSIPMNELIKELNLFYKKSFKLINKLLLEKKEGNIDE